MELGKKTLTWNQSQKYACKVNYTYMTCIRMQHRPRHNQRLYNEFRLGSYKLLSKYI